MKTSFQCGDHFCIVRGVSCKKRSPDYPIHPVPQFVVEACARYDNFKVSITRNPSHKKAGPVEKVLLNISKSYSIANDLFNIK